LDKVICGKCRIVLSEVYGLAIEKRQACTSCGAQKRIYTKHLIARSILLAGVRLKAFENGLRKPFIKLIVTPSFSFKIQRWSYLYRLIDRRHDVYHELVTDPKSNSIIHECKEPLSAHKGHGSARK
jgi:hypothetical protein